ncbi:MAG: transketolase family protein [Defluviitaleaceae bacterium]|nr:transketolase family protein [Defluviitaleaceae bacterium]MCL2835543.1 transketolase family protein [Defluviitaleaceae bacterium]
MLEERMLRDTYCDLLIEHAKENKNIVLLDADLSKAGGLKRFMAAFPDRFINVGVAEANMIGIAAGLSAMGWIPFTHTFTPFATRRVCDQVTLSVAYAGLNVKMAGSDPGIAAELNGGTHMSLEDVAIMRNIPGMVIFEPVDSAQLKSVFPQILNYDGGCYIRLFRKNAVKVYEDGTEFTLGKGHVIKSGKDVTIIATGIMVSESVKAADELEKLGVSAELINIHTIKPLDTDLILNSAKKTGAVVAAENHSVVNGLGSAVAEFLSENFPVPVKRIGVRDRFGEVGKTDYLKTIMNMRAEDIVQAAQSVIKR